MKIWHDDIRRPPDESWEWARTNGHAKKLLLTGQVDEISLDRDLGLHNEDPDQPDAWLLMGTGEETGDDLVKWMCAQGIFPAKITIHSMNVVRAKEMKAIFGDHGCYHARTEIYVPPHKRKV